MLTKGKRSYNKNKLFNVIEEDKQTPTTTIKGKLQK